MSRRVEARSVVHTYARLLQVARHTLKVASEQPEGSVHLLLASITFSAFALEAYLNHAGERIFPYWEEVERLRPKAKLSLICDKLRIEVDFSRQPFQSFSTGFRIRNLLAHGRTETVRSTTSDERSIEDPFEVPETTWEQYCTHRVAGELLSNARALVKTIHSAAGFQEDAFNLGYSGGIVSVSDEVE